jgi:hypothetical protein
MHTLSEVTSIFVTSDEVDPTFCHAFLPTSLLSTRYSRILEPPSDSDACHLIVRDVSVIPVISKGPRGGDGGSVVSTREHYKTLEHVVQLTILTLNDDCIAFQRFRVTDRIGRTHTEHVLRTFV